MRLSNTPINSVIVVLDWEARVFALGEDDDDPRIVAQEVVNDTLRGTGFYGEMVSFKKTALHENVFTAVFISTENLKKEGAK